MPVSGSAAQDWFQEAGYDLLPVTPAHAAAVEHLPDIHRDPFDRLLMAQAATEPMGLLTRDPPGGSVQRGCNPGLRRPAGTPRAPPASRRSR